MQKNHTLKMLYDNRHNILINKIVTTALHLQINVITSRYKYYVLSEDDYAKIQQLKKILEELEEIDTIPIDDKNNVSE